MEPHECLFFSRHIAMGRGGMEKDVHYLDDHLPATFSHPLKMMEDCVISMWSSPSIFGVLELK